MLNVQFEYLFFVIKLLCSKQAMFFSRAHLARRMRAKESTVGGRIAVQPSQLVQFVESDFDLHSDSELVSLQWQGGSTESTAEPAGSRAESRVCCKPDQGKDTEGRVAVNLSRTNVGIISWTLQVESWLMVVVRHLKDTIPTPALIDRRTLFSPMVASQVH